MLNRRDLCRNSINIHGFRVVLGVLPYFHAMSYAKMFHGRDKMKHFMKHFETW